MSMWALVYWMDTSQVSVMPEKFIKDKSMLTDPQKVGKVTYGVMGKKAQTWMGFL